MNTQIELIKSELEKAYRHWLRMYYERFLSDNPFNMNTSDREKAVDLDMKGFNIFTETMDTDLIIEVSYVKGLTVGKAFHFLTEDETQNIIKNLVRYVRQFDIGIRGHWFLMKIFTMVASYKVLQSALFDESKEVRQLASLLNGLSYNKSIKGKISYTR